MMNTAIFTQYESQVRSYCRTFPVVFERAKGALLYAETGRIYIDFFAGAGALNYGHNDDRIKAELIDYLSRDGITQGLDLYTVAKRAFIESFQRHILFSRGLSYKLQFCGPTGTNAVEAALKIARKVTGRSGVFAFMGSYHGMSLGSLAVTGSKYHRAAAGTALSHVTFLPYPHGFMGSFDTIAYIEAILDDDYSGIENPAAIIVETIQAEGGVVVAPIEWLRHLARLCNDRSILLICDDIQVGCGRTGQFFSFERAGLTPDIVLLSKSLGGYSLPIALVLLKPDLDQWHPGEHNGTFRGNQLAFVGAAAAIETFWVDRSLEQEVARKESFVAHFLQHAITTIDERIQVRGTGLIWGVDLSAWGRPEIGHEVVQRCFEAGLVIECVGRQNQVIKLLPPLTIEMDLLEQGCEILRQAVVASRNHH
jgi:diaminobutyrate-2-oxoglutarate transaminase